MVNERPFTGMEEDTTFESIWVFFCMPGEGLVGANSITCESSGAWSAAVPSCGMDSLNIFLNGHRKLVANSTYTSKFISIPLSNVCKYAGVVILVPPPLLVPHCCE